MPLRTQTLTLISQTELLMDQDNIIFAEDVSRWHKDPENKDLQAPGDDRVPAWAWLGKLHYTDFTPEHEVGVPVGMLQACLRAASAMIPHPTAKAPKTLKDISQSGIFFTETLFPLYVHRPGDTDWVTIAYSELHTKLRHEMDFATHQAVAVAMGCPLDVRRAKPSWKGGAHVRVRPKFGPWRLVCEMNVVEDVLSEEIILRMFELAGRYKGLGNWRPSTPHAGAYGTFRVEDGRQL